MVLLSPVSGEADGTQACGLRGEAGYPLGLQVRPGKSCLSDCFLFLKI